MLTTFMRHASAETSTLCYMNGLSSGGSPSHRCKIEWMTKPANRETSLICLARSGAMRAKVRLGLSSLIESGRHGFVIGGGMSSSEQARTSGD